LDDQERGEDVKAYAKNVKFTIVASYSKAYKKLFSPSFNACFPTTLVVRKIEAKNQGIPDCTLLINNLFSRCNCCTSVTVLDSFSRDEHYSMIASLRVLSFVIWATSCDDVTLFLYLSCG
jgi:hypothetical protein